MPNYVYYNSELYHYGVKGMKWGVRRYQNADGSLTKRGIKKYAKKGYKRDAYGKNTNLKSQIYDVLNNHSRSDATMEYLRANETQRKVRATKYLQDKKQEDKIVKQLKKDRSTKFMVGKRAVAQYMIDNNEPVASAKKKVRTQQAVRVTATTLAVIGSAHMVGKTR